MLGCLVAAMSGTAALLGWMAPSTTCHPFPMLRDEIVQLARSGVMDGVVVRGEQWLDVEVATTPGRILGSSMLAATGQSTSWHFFIDRSGHPYRGDAWGDQRVSAQTPGTVRILVMELDGSQAMSSVQWFCVQALVSALNEALGMGETSLPIHLQQGWPQTYGAPFGGNIEFSWSKPTTG